SAGAVDEVGIELPPDNNVLKASRHTKSNEGAAGHVINANFSSDHDEIRKLDMKLSRKMWIHFGKDSENVFNLLRLSKLEYKFDESKKTIQWFDSGDEEFSDYLIDADLSRKGKLSEVKMAELFQALAHVPDLKNLAEIVQNVQYKVWITKHKTPADIADMLMVRLSGPRPTDTSVHPRYTIISAYQ
ncbi:hypothetical protein GN958_ATG19526, partial [Phytophthora infestans]